MPVKKNLRRGIKYGGVGLMIAIVVLPVVAHLLRRGPDGMPPPMTELEQMILWLAVALIALFFFQLGYRDWGEDRRP